MDGNDTLVGDAGSDSLIGGAGDDDYVVAVGSGTDVIDNTGGGFDGIFFEGTVTREQLSFSRDGDDLLISIDNNTTPAARVTNHFLGGDARSEEHTSELQSLMRISYAVFCLKKKK